MRFSAPFFFRLFVACLFLLPLSDPGRANQTSLSSSMDRRRVLVLYSYNNNLVSQQHFHSGLEKARKNAGLPSGDFLHEYLDIKPLDGHGQRGLLRQLILEKYRSCRFDLIVTVYEPALDFLLNELGSLSPESPCFAIFATKRPGLKRAGREVLQFPLNFDLQGTLSMALDLFPDANRAVIVLGTGKADRAMEKWARDNASRWKPRLDLEFTSGLGVEETVRHVAGLSRGTLVICSRIETDISGRTFVPRDVTVQIAQKSNVPVFCLVSAQLDTGALGGSLIDYEHVGAMLSRAVVDISAGRHIAIEPPLSYTRPMVNWEQVLRWHIDPARLPQGTVLINRPKKLWDQYKAPVFAAFALFLSLFAFIVILLMENRRRAWAEKSATASESRFRVLFEQAPDAIVVYDFDKQKLVDANAEAEKLFGCDRNTLLSTGLLPFYTLEQPDGRDAATSSKDHFQQVMDEKTLHFERSLQTMDGRRLFCDVRLVRLPSENRRLIRASYIDITERKEAEEAIRQEKERYQYILQTAMGGFCLTDRAGRFLEVNDTYCQISGYSAEELKTMTIGDVEAFDNREELENQAKIVLEKGRARFETRQRRKDGRLIDVEVSASYLPSAGGRFVVFIADITGRKQAEAQRKLLEAQLQQSRKMEVLGTLAGGIAHDFNNILFPIMGFTEMLLDTCQENSEAHQSLEQILTATLRAADLVQQILAFSRQSEIERLPVKVQTIIQDALKLMRASLPSTISIESDIDKRCGMVMASPTHIHQIAMNLMTNAFHAMEDTGGTLSVSLWGVSVQSDGTAPDIRPGRYILYSVADTGHGIERQILDRIFEPYFTTKQAGKGTGLGLSVVHGIVKSYGGDIRVTSEPGKGSVFDVYLPVMDPSDSENTLDSVRLQVEGGSEHILLVDDEETILKMERKMLEPLGYRVTTRSKSTEALELFRKSPDEFDLVITDKTMPDMTGEKLAAELKRINGNIPVILCTGFSTPTSQETGKSSDVDRFLMKPVVKNDLLKTIRSLLDEEKHERTHGPYSDY